MALNQTENSERIEVKWPAMAVPAQYARNAADRAKYGVNVAANTGYEAAAGAVGIPAHSTISIIGGSVIGAKTLAVKTPWEMLKTIVQTPLAIFGPPVRKAGDALKKGWDKSLDIVTHPIQRTRGLIGSLLGLPRRAAHALAPVAKLDVNVRGMVSGFRAKIGGALSRMGSTTKSYLGGIVEPSVNLARTAGRGLLAPFSSRTKKGERMGFHGVLTSVRNGFSRIFNSFSTAKSAPKLRLAGA